MQYSGTAAAAGGATTASDAVPFFSFSLRALKIDQIIKNI